MTKEIKKCKVCGEPFWDDNEMEKKEGTGGACYDCVKKADQKEYREINQPMQM